MENTYPYSIPKSPGIQESIVESKVSTLPWQFCQHHQKQVMNPPIINNLEERSKVLSSMKRYEQEVNQFRCRIFREHLHYDEWQAEEIPEILARYGIELCQNGVNFINSELKQKFDHLLPKLKELNHPRLRKLFELISFQQLQQQYTKPKTK